MSEETYVRERFWPKVRRVARKLPFTDDLLAAYYCALDPTTPKSAKAVLMGALAYFIMPADLLPDFLAAIGFSDDATVLFAAVQAVRANLTPDHYARARAALEDAAPAGPSGQPAGQP